LKNSSWNIPSATKIVHAVSRVSLQIARCENVGLVGESGAASERWAPQCGRCAGRFGRVLFDGHDPHGDAGRYALRHDAPALQLIFKDPIAS